MTSGTYEVATAVLGAAVSVTIAAALFFALVRGEVAVSRRGPLSLAVIACAVTGVHGWLTLQNWTAAFVSGPAGFVPSGERFVVGLRSTAWIMVAPLLIGQFLSVLGLEDRLRRRLFVRASVAAVLLVSTGWVGAVTSDVGTRLALWLLGAVAYLFIVYTLWLGLGEGLPHQRADIAPLVAKAGLALALSWLVHPMVAVLPLLGLDGGYGLALGQVSTVTGDVCATAVFGFLVYRIVRLESIEELPWGSKPPVRVPVGNRPPGGRIDLR